ncbi:MAG TPA: TraR/DksA C4-type zinc finger protein [Acidimicrobiales bacterium]
MEPFDPDQELSLLAQVEAELAAVDGALERLDRGTYGRCEACGEPVPDERLAAAPTAGFCPRHGPGAAA